MELQKEKSPKSPILLLDVWRLYYPKRRLYYPWLLALPIGDGSVGGRWVGFSAGRDVWAKL